MGRTKPAPRTHATRPQRPSPASMKPRGEQQLSDATWTRLCLAIRAMQPAHSPQRDDPAQR